MKPYRVSVNDRGAVLKWQDKTGAAREALFNSVRAAFRFIRLLEDVKSSGVVQHGRENIEMG